MAERRRQAPGPVRGTSRSPAEHVVHDGAILGSAVTDRVVSRDDGSYDDICLYGVLPRTKNTCN
jgi:hypothetical protein